MPRKFGAIRYFVKSLMIVLSSIYIDKSSKIREGQAGFRAGRCCIDNIFTLNELIQGRLKEGKKTFSFFLDIQKAPL